MTKEYFIVQMKKDFDSNANDRTYRKNERLMVYEKEYLYIILNNNHDAIPKHICNIIYKLNAEVVQVTNKNIFEYVLNHHGIKNQLKKTLEELEELSQEIQAELAGNGEIVNLIEEIADVENMLEQLKLYYKFDLSVRNVRRQKMEREVGRLEDENNKED